MISLNFGGIVNSLYSITLLNAPFYFNNSRKGYVEQVSLNEEITDKIEIPKLIDFKTPLGWVQSALINEIHEDVTAYFFIQKTLTFSSWNLVVPVIVGEQHGVCMQFALGNFALQGLGGGFSNMKSIFHYLKLLRNRGYKVTTLPKVVGSDLLKDFEYWDSGVKLDTLLENSIDLINYRKGVFEGIYKEYRGLEKEYVGKYQ